MNRGQRSYSIPNYVIANGGNDTTLDAEAGLLGGRDRTAEAGAGGLSSGEETEMPLLPQSKS